jgi:voltage-gated sodium channel
VQEEIDVNAASTKPNCFRKLTHSSCFEAFILIVIVFASLMVGVQTDKEIASSQEDVLNLIEDIILVIFTVEMVLNVCAECPRPWLYFNEGWNIFDFFLVLMSFLKYIPSAGLADASRLFFVLRLLRLLRVLKLMKSIPQLQVIVYGLLKGMSSISYIMLLLCFVFYTFGVTSIIFFRANDPWHFGSLGTSMVTLFRVATGEDWTDVMYINMYGCAAYGYESDALAPMCTASKGLGLAAAVYFIFFFFIASLCILTLFVGVVTTSMDEQRQEMEHKVKLMARVKEIMKTEEITAERLLSYREIFTLFDADDSGEVDDIELLLAMRAIGLKPTTNQVNGMMLEVDSDNNGAIDFAEFVHFMVS